MNEIKKQRTYLIPFIVVLIILLVAICYIVFEMKFNSTAKMSDEIEKNKINIIDNFATEDNVHFLTKSIVLSYEDEKENEEKYDLVYNYSGENQGKLMIGNYEFLEEEMIEIPTSKTIKDIEVFTTRVEKDENLEWVDNLFILYEDGTIGKITAEQIYNKDYRIEMIKDLNSIEYFMPLGVTAPNASGGAVLYGINKNGKAIYIDGI